MSRVQLEQLNIDGLREVARQHGLDIHGARAVLFDRITDHFERQGWPETISILPPVTEDRQVVEQEAQAVQEVVANANAGELAPRVQTAEAGRHSGRGISAENAFDLQDIVRAVIQALNVAQGQQVSAAPDWSSSEARPMTSPSSDSQSSGVHNWNQIKFASKLIPSFTGKEDENIISWLERIASIVGMYQVPDEVLVIAAVNQLSGRALSWYNRQRVESVASWQDFKRQIRLYFERKETVTMTLSRINARIWRAQSEKFIDYAEDKLKLMQFLTLTEKERIELLADGVKDFAFRRFALNSWAASVLEFLEHMRRILEDSVIARRTGFDTASQRTSPRLAVSRSGISYSHCKKSGHLAKDCRVAAMTCFACGQKGHLSSACQKNKSVPGTTLNHLAEVSMEEEEPQSEEAAAEEASSGIYVIEGEIPYIAVSRCGFPDKSFRALINTGNPIKLIYQNGRFKFECPAEEPEQVDFIFQIEIDDSRERCAIVMENLDGRVDGRTRERLVDLLHKVEKLKMSPVVDDYQIRVHIKDPSLFRYAPRRFSFLEKLDLRAITDDLLKREIIKPSISSYCSCVVLVEKRNGQKRVCVDLRPLNQRIYPQKYPFPIIKDQINQLQGSGRISEKNLSHIGSFDTEQKILVYMDDILIATSTIDENLEILEEVLQQLKKYKLELNYAKCIFLKREIEYLGYVISFKAGDFVLVKVLQHKPGSNQKLVPKYKGPYLVKAVLKKNRFVITDIPGFNIKQKPLNTIMSANKLKPWIKISSPKENEKPNEIYKESCKEL
ncbi:PREDICTED: uncharacterized protein LOC105453626 [Wasmannia auropunctata]|uniref:uncharacterized protein LOC105453626 n=1 Tax=Wasmannia auropunctata TaxID=64793 RepID=UPI0005EFCD8C|nr:PREDICTED: uncharacterized protein LOC105453626 [Wasmannia auropunctata]